MSVERKESIAKLSVWCKRCGWLAGVDWCKESMLRLSERRFVFVMQVI